MFNPLMDNLTELKDEEISSKTADLIKKYNIALKMGNGALAQQIVVALDALQSENVRRQYEASKRLLEKQNKDLDGLINVG